MPAALSTLAVVRVERTSAVIGEVTVAVRPPGRRSPDRLGTIGSGGAVWPCAEPIAGRADRLGSVFA
jgi:hypothetical protein